MRTNRVDFLRLKTEVEKIADEVEKHKESLNALDERVRQIEMTLKGEPESHATKMKEKGKKAVE